MAGLLLDGDGPAALVELHHAEGAGGLHPIAEDGGSGLAGGGLLQRVAQGGGIEDVVPQDQAHVVGAHKLPADEQGVGDAPGHRLLRIGDLQPVLAAVAQQGPEGVRLPGGDDDHNIGDPSLHQNGDGIIDQRLVIDGQERLAHRLGHGIKAGALSRG